LSQYDIFLEQVKRNHNVTVREAIAKLYELLKEEDSNLSKDDMYDRIMKDCLEIWARSTIIRHMPDELKDKERQESGRKGREKRLLTVTNDGSVATGVQANSSEDGPGSPKQAEPKPGLSEDWEGQKRKLFEANHNGSEIHFTSQDSRRDAIIEAQRMDIGRLQEQLKEHKEQIRELIKSVNAASSLKEDKKITIPSKQTPEYLSLLSELELVRHERDDLKQIATMQMKANPSQTFQSAANYKPSPANTNANTDTREIEFPAKELTTFFMASRIAKQTMYLKIDDNNKVVGWESDAKRIAAKATA
jgi:hypothetical protein